MKLLVSIHDVTPAHDEGVRALWAVCAARGVLPALFVVPNWHGAWRLRTSPDFLSWVRARADDGAEVFLHGERHDEVVDRRTMGDHVRAWGRTDAEGEFLSLNTDETAERISRGIDELRACGLNPIGFVPPAWLGRRGWTQVVAASGLRFSEDDESVHLHDRAMRIASPVTRWSARSRLRSRVSATVASLRWYCDQTSPCVRVALHPQDLHSPEVCESIQLTLDRWLLRHHTWRYAAL